MVQQPAACPDPVCTPDAPGAKCTKVVCNPEEKAAVLWVNAAVVAVLTGDSLARLLTIGAVPASAVHSEALAIDLGGNLVDVLLYRTPSILSNPPPVQTKRTHNRRPGCGAAAGS